MFALIGREGRTQRLDTPAKVNGSARYTIDITEPGMLTVVVARPRRFGARPGQIDAAAALRVKGCGCGEGDLYWLCRLRHRHVASPQGTQSADRDLGRECCRNTRQRANDRRVPRAHQIAWNDRWPKGDVEAASGEGRELVEASYVFPYLAHAPMEPLDGYIRWDGDSAVARYGCQMQTPDQGAIAKVLGLPSDKVTIETMLAGGSFGRRAQASLHFPIELAEVARESDRIGQ